MFSSFQTTVDKFISIWAIEGVHLSLAKQDMLGANVNLNILPVNEVLQYCISFKNTK